MPNDTVTLTSDELDTIRHEARLAGMRELVGNCKTVLYDSGESIYPAVLITEITDYARSLSIDRYKRK